MPKIVVTAVGRDRTGLVSQFTKPLLDVRANLADSRMVNLGGQFALLALVEGDDGALAQARETLTREAERLGLTVTFTREADGYAPKGGVPYLLKTYSADQPGIVHRVTSLLQEQGVNVEELASRLEPMPFSGAPIFTMEARVTVPATVPLRKLRRDLEALCDDLNCDVELEPVP